MNQAAVFCAAAWLAVTPLPGQTGAACAQAVDPPTEPAPAPSAAAAMAAAPPKQEPTAVVPEPATPPAPAPLAAPPMQPAQAALAAPSTPAPKIIEWIEHIYPVPETIAVMTAPQTDAELLGRVRKGTDVEVVGLLTDPMWLQVRLPDKTLGYVLASSIPAAGPGGESLTPAPAKAVAPENAVPVAPPPVEGEAVLFTTSVVLLSDASYPLADVDGFNGPTRNEMADFLKSTNGWVHCEPASDATFICKLRDGTDLAKAALVNGAARVTPTAPRDYVAQQENAKSNHRGIWRDGAAGVDAIPFSDGQGAALVAGQSYVPGVAYAGADGVPAAFAAAAPQDGLALIDGQPFTLDEGIPAPLVYEPAVGWGFWDRSFVWRRAPAGWSRRLEQFHPRGQGLREVDLEHRGFALHENFFHGPAVNAALPLGHAPPQFGPSPYTPSVFRAVARPAMGGGFPQRARPGESMPFHGEGQRPSGGAPGRRDFGAAPGGAPHMNAEMPRGGERPYGHAPPGPGLPRASGMPPGMPPNRPPQPGPAAALANRQAIQAGRMGPPQAMMAAHPVAVARPAPVVRAPPPAPAIVRKH